MPERAPTGDEIRTLYDAWSTEEGYPTYTRSEYEIMFAASRAMTGEGLEILDVGCGEGVVAGFLKARGHRVTGLDLSEKALEKAKRLGRIDTGIVADVYASGLPRGRFDVVVCFSVLLHLFDLDRLFSEVHALLKPGGEIVIMDHHRRNPYTKLHFSRPNWIDRLVERRSNVPRRPLTEEMIFVASGGLFSWKSTRHLSVFTRHPNPVINIVHDAARGLFGGIRRLSRAPWTGNMLVMVGERRESRNQ